MFEASNDTNITSGNLVEAQFVGMWKGCTTGGNECKKYSPTTNVIGTWDLNSSGILTMDTNSSKQYYRFNSGTLEEAWIDKAGSSYNMEWVTGGSDTTVNSSIEATIRASF